MPLTPARAKRLVKSIIYRRRLLEELPELEAELVAYVEMNGIKYLAGYEVSMNDGDLHFRKLDPLEYRQLRLKFDDYL